MIPDRLIEQDTLTTDGVRSSVEVRIPWYRALPASCIAGVTFVVDGAAAPADSIRWTMNGRTFRMAELVDDTDDWWFPTDSAVVSGEVSAAEGGERRVDIGLQLYIPYIIIGDGEVLRIEEHDSKSMTPRTTVTVTA